MGKVKVAALSLSLDGFGAGPDQSEAHPAASVPKACTRGSSARAPSRR